ncbi:L,D-transpeptidase family protein [Amaricoccus macauensis]|uniref:L,D-transpeptidase family protein n=1 Tax=Amaricoccus macauensis TaxID=57001 RepID=UPI003C7D7E60
MTSSSFARALCACATAALLVHPVMAQDSMAQEGSGAIEAIPAAFEADALSPEAMAFEVALASQTEGFSEDERAAIGGFYESRDFQPYWTAGSAAPLAALRAAIGTASAQGLPANRYDLSALEATDGAPEGAAAVPLELAAMRAYLQWGGDLTGGIVRPLSVDDEINVRPERATAGDLLGRLADGSASDVLSGLEPQDPDYAALMAERKRLTAMAQDGGLGPRVPTGPSLHVGESSPRVVALRDRLAKLGYASETEGDARTALVETAGAPDAAPAFDATAFDPRLEAELKAFQRDQGLNDDGVAGPRTLAALNVSVADRIRMIDVNLERMRWFNRDLGNRRIEVNIPDYSVEMIENGAVVWSSRTVVGEVEETRTPEFSDEMTHMVVNPTWHIPDSIATRVYLPKLRSDPDVLRRNGMSLFTRSGMEINPSLVDFSQYSAETFPFRVKQNPSSANALGRVKFMFPNQFAIYLHDTPARQYFARDARALSNGCIRLEKPLELAYVLLDGQVSNPEARFDGWLASKSETYVNLDDPVQVHLMYRTVFVDETGKIRYREDIYGRDAKVFAALQARGVQLPDGVQG